mgnify:CR=1 FL=1
MWFHTHIARCAQRGRPQPAAKLYARTWGFSRGQATTRGGVPVQLRLRGRRYSRSKAQAGIQRSTVVGVAFATPWSRLCASAEGRTESKVSWFSGRSEDGVYRLTPRARGVSPSSLQHFFHITSYRRLHRYSSDMAAKVKANRGFASKASTSLKCM